MSNKIVIIDGYSLANRAYFALPPLSSKGQPTNAVYGLTMMLLRLLEEFQPDYIVTAFDVAAPTFRHQEYDAYKGQRAKMDDAFRVQFPLIRQLFEILGIPIYEQAGFEADDLIGTFSVKAAAAGLQVDIITGDRDSFQLVNPNVNVRYIKKGITDLERVDEAYIKNRYQLIPRQLIELKGLMGDASDNIPGVPGFGEKTSLKYLALYGSIDGIYEHLEEITNQRHRNLLIEYKDQAYLSRHLAEIRLDVDISLDLDQCCRHRQIDRKKLLEFCQELGFNSLVQNLAKTGVTPQIPAVPELECSITEINQDQLAAVVRQIHEEGICYLQFLTTVANWREINCVGLGIASREHNWYYSLENQNCLPEALQSLMADESVIKYGYDLKRQAMIVAMKGAELKGKFEDALIAGYLVNAGVGGLELEDLVRTYLEQTISLGNQQRGSKFSIFELSQKPLLGAGWPELAGKCLESLKQLRPRLQQLLAEQQMEQLYTEVELPLIKVLFEMERTGIALEPERLRSFGQELKTRQKVLEAGIYELAEEQFNISSPKQLGQILFEKLALRAPKKTKTGYSTDITVLKELVDQHPIIAQVIEYRQNLKLQSTYIDSLINLINPNTGRVHTSFNQAVTTTGRLSSTEPNLQNIPVRTEAGNRIRNAFVPGSAACQLLSVDYSQIELRVMAHFSKDPAYMEAFLHGEDIHKYTAAAVWDVSLAEVTPQMRSRAKAVNFGIIYGISGFGLAQNIEVSRKEAEEFIQAYFNKYPGVKRYVEQLIEVARETGEARTLLGRLRKLPDLNSRNFNLRSFAERMARNTPIQGTAADIIKVAMVKIGQRLALRPELGKLLLQVHDELIFEVPRDSWRELAVVVKTEMEEALTLDVPLVVDFKLGDNWGSMKAVSLSD